MRICRELFPLARRHGSHKRTLSIVVCPIQTQSLDKLSENKFRLIYQCKNNISLFVPSTFLSRLSAMKLWQGCYDTHAIIYE